MFASTPICFPHPFTLCNGLKFFLVSIIYLRNQVSICLLKHESTASLFAIKRSQRDQIRHGYFNLLHFQILPRLDSWFEDVASIFLFFFNIKLSSTEIVFTLGYNSQAPTTPKSTAAPPKITTLIRAANTG